MVQLTNVQNALEKVLMPYIQDNFPKQTVLMDQIKKNTGVQFFNDTFYAPVRTSRHGGITNLANDNSTLRSGGASIGQASIGVKIVTGTFDITDLAKKATATKKGAVADQLNWQSTTLGEDYARDINRQYFSDGVGALAQVVGSVGVGTFTVALPDSNLDDGRSIDNYGTVNGDISPTKYLTVGMAIGIGTAAADVGTISSINGNTVVVTGSPAIAANDTIYKVDGDDAGAGTAEIQGIRAALSSTTGTATYAGLARSTTGWTPQVDATSETLTLERMMDKALDAMEYAKKGDRFGWFVNKSLYRKYGSILTSMRRTVNSTQLLGGWSGLSFDVGVGGNIGVFLDNDTPDGMAILINLDSWTVCEVAPMEWVEGDNGRPMIRRRDKLTYQATMAWYTNLLCLAPAANAVLYRKTKA